MNTFLKNLISVYIFFSFAIYILDQMSICWKQQSKKSIMISQETPCFLAHFHLAAFWGSKFASFTTIFISLEWKVSWMETGRFQLQRKRNLLQMRSRKWKKLWTTNVLQQKLITAVLKLAQLQNYQLHTSTHDTTTSSLCSN